MGSGLRSAVVMQRPWKLFHVFSPNGSVKLDSNALNDLLKWTIKADKRMRVCVSLKGQGLDVTRHDGRETGLL